MRKRKSHLVNYKHKDRGLCGRLLNGAKVYKFSDECPEEICGTCGRLEDESWESAMRSVFEHGGSDDEREALGKYFGI